MLDVILLRHLWQLSMSTSRPITVQELQEIRRSVLEAVRRASIAFTPEGRCWTRLMQGKAYTREHFNADGLLDDLRFAPRPQLSEERVRNTFLHAMNRNDVRFFIRLGKVLSRRPGRRPRLAGIHIPAQYIQFLITHWAEPADGLPELFYLTPDGLADVCTYYFKIDFSVVALVKLRQRLGLKPFRRKKVRVLLVGRKLKFPKMDMKAK